MKRLAIILTLAAFLVLPAVAAAVYFVWPSPWVTVQMRGSNPQCSTTAMGPDRALGAPNTFDIYFGGGTSCATGRGLKSLTVELQIAVPNRPGHIEWLPAKTLVQNGYAGNPLRLRGFLHVVGGGTSHQYRVSATGLVTFGTRGYSSTAISKVLTA